MIENLRSRDNFPRKVSSPQFDDNAFEMVVSHFLIPDVMIRKNVEDPMQIFNSIDVQFVRVQGVLRKF